MDEIEEKSDRIVRLCHTLSLRGVLLTTQANFAWATGGRTNRIDGSTEQGNGGLLVTAGGRRFVIANAIEMPRLAGEALRGLSLEPLEHEWTDDLSAPSTMLDRAREAAGGGEIGVDWLQPGGVPVGPALMRVRSPLTSPEIERYRKLGSEVGRIVGEYCRTVPTGLSERAVAGQVAAAVGEAGARAVVTLVGADERIAAYRHPVPTDRPWRQQLMIVVCAEREGLVVALTRLVHAASEPSDLASRTRAAAGVFERLLDATTPGRSGRELFLVAQQAYAAAGYPGEERRHHQGGAIGYRPRDWIAHPVSDEHVGDRQAFAWNPSITGTKIEETALLIDGRVELLTSTPGWPSIPVRAAGAELPAPVALGRS